MIQTSSTILGTIETFQSQQEFPSLKAAFRAAAKDKTIWGISFDAEDGSRVSLIKAHTPITGTKVWIYSVINLAN